MERQERLLKAFQYLKEMGIVKTRQETAKRIGMDNGNLSKALNGDTRYLTDGMLRRFNEAFGNPFSLPWLISEKGEWLSSDKPITKFNREGTPYYNIDIENLPLSLAGVQSEFDMVIPTYSNIDFWCNMSGDSMRPVICGGDMIALKLIDDVSFISFGEIYSIVLESDVRVVRRICASDKEGYITLCPINRDGGFSDQMLPLNSIKSLYKVSATIRRL